MCKSDMDPEVRWMIENDISGDDLMHDEFVAAGLAFVFVAVVVGLVVWAMI